MKKEGDDGASSVEPEYLWRRPGYVLKVVERLQRREMDHVLAKIGLTTPQYAALSVLANRPGVSNAELARRSFVTAQTMTDILRVLHRDGRVTRTPHPDHGRIIQYQLTGDGERLRALADIEIRAIERAMLSALSEEEQATLLGMLMRCADSLAEESERGGIER